MIRSVFWGVYCYSVDIIGNPPGHSLLFRPPHYFTGPAPKGVARALTELLVRSIIGLDKIFWCFGVEGFTSCFFSEVE